MISCTKPYLSSHLKSHLNFLILRPQPQASNLAQELTELGYQAAVFPLIHIQAKQHLPQLAKLNEADLLIAVSKNALLAANSYMQQQGILWPNKALYLAIGQSTAMLWHEILQKQSIHFAAPLWPQAEHSETLLELPPLKQAANKRVVILKGNAGRELLAETLGKRGAKLTHINCYERVPQIKTAQSLLASCLDFMSQAKPLCLVLTSAEQLYLVNEQILSVQNSESLLQFISLIVPSQRVADIAKNLGFLRVYQSQGATNHAIIAQIQKLQNGEHAPCR